MSWLKSKAHARGLTKPLTRRDSPIDTYKKDLDAIANEPLHYDWEAFVNQSKRTACVTPRFLP